MRHLYDAVNNQKPMQSARILSRLQRWVSKWEEDFEARLEARYLGIRSNVVRQRVPEVRNRKFERSVTCKNRIRT